MTADLEFLMCDLCHVYFHKDIFCPHRRACRGPNCTEMDKSEAETITKRLDQAERRLTESCSAAMGSAAVVVGPSQPLASCLVGKSITVDQEVQRRRDAVRTSVSDRYAERTVAQSRERAKRIDVDALMADLDAK